MRLQPWTTRLRRRNKPIKTRATGQFPPEVDVGLYDPLATLYPPIEPSKHDLRVIILAPGEFTEYVSCELRAVSFLGNPSYEALSYAWGEHRPYSTIYINGLRHTVSGNLESALRHLRYRDKPRTLWVDALCINQGDINERNSQVRLMGTIYSNCTGVLAWLGPEYNDSDLAFDFLETMPGDPEVHWDPEAYPNLKTVYKLSHTIALNDLFERAWWHRVWTVQESVLGPALTFVCGSRQLPAQQAFDVAYCWFKHMYTCCQDPWYTIFKSTAGQPGLGDVCTILRKIKEMRTSIGHFRFTQILSKFMSRQCSDPHDKVYGLLGFASEEESSFIVPDYSKPVAQLYREVSLALIQHTGELDILSMHYPKTPNHDDSLVDTLPSWVPDWSVHLDPSVLHDIDDRLSCVSFYRASGDTRCHVEATLSGSLLVRGKIISRISLLSSDENHLDAASLKNFFLEWQKMVGADKDPSRLYAKSKTTTISDAFWQTLCCSLIPDRDAPREKAMHRTTDDSPYKPWFDAWWEWLQEHDCDPHKLMDIRTEYSRAEINVMGGLVSTSINMRRLFMSEEDGWIGLVPVDARVGDIVVLLEGGRVPYILRPADNPEGENDIQHYELMGPAYVHGVMDGSEWDDNHLQEFYLL
ncbi:heterokaryon incompatibility protein-domain-containing protein [Xylaria sp. FL0933]|nr:heterokaryon incompatibility protein-domain-containing protein [Xylaria sp. FL0933]